jgi:hypothetical protein
MKSHEIKILRGNLGAIKSNWKNMNQIEVRQIIN